MIEGAAEQVNKFDAPALQHYVRQAPKTCHIYNNFCNFMAVKSLTKLLPPSIFSSEFLFCLYF